jgi:DNA primase
LSNSGREIDAKHMQNALSSTEYTEEHLNFLKNRPLSKETLEVWKIGFCPLQWRYKGFPYIRGRIITPIFDIYDNIISFAGRKLETLEEQAYNIFTEEFGPSKGSDIFRTWDRSKWINEPYDKHKHLYGLNINKENILKTGYAIIVEGNFSVVTLWDNDVKNVVATCGTSLNIIQVCLLRRYTKNLVILTDGDEAGQKAADRYKFLLNDYSEDINILKITMPDGYDPEDYVRKFGGTRIKYTINQAIENNLKETHLSVIPNEFIKIS